MTTADQNCPICRVPVEPSPRYPNYVCADCYAKAVDENGRKLAFTNESFSGGFIAFYPDTREKRDSHICYINGTRCWADEAYMGGTLIRTYAEED